MACRSLACREMHAKPLSCPKRPAPPSQLLVWDRTDARNSPQAQRVGGRRRAHVACAKAWVMCTAHSTVTVNAADRDVRSSGRTDDQRLEVPYCMLWRGDAGLACAVCTPTGQVRQPRQQRDPPPSSSSSSHSHSSALPQPSRYVPVALVPMHAVVSSSSRPGPPGQLGAALCRLLCLPMDRQHPKRPISIK